MSVIARTSRQSRQSLGRILDRHLPELTRRIYVGETSGSAPQVQVDLAGERTGNASHGQRVISIFDLTGPRNSYKSNALRDHLVRWQSGSSAALPTDDSSRKTKPEENKDDPAGDSNNGQLVHSQYWGIAPKSFTREDGSPWLWNCFRPWEAYRTDTTIDVDKHYIPTGFVDKFADILVEKVLSPMSDAFFRERWGCHAVMLETVAAIPGMVGGMLLHLRSLRRFEHSGGWIKALLEEAENERMHLMTFMEVSKPVWHERLLVMAVQGVFFNGYFILYLVSPQLAHRFAGYLEEVAVQSYTRYLAAIDKGEIENIPAPAIAIDYWRLPKDARLRDVVIVVRADEAHHRDVQHFAADIRKQGKQLSEAPAPVGYQ